MCLLAVAPQRLAHSTSLSSLFPDSDEPVYINTSQAVEAARVVFKLFSDVADQASVFVARLERLSDDAGTLLYDDVVRMLMSEYRKRAVHNMLHLRALFMACDADRDGLITEEEARWAIALVAPNMPVQQVMALVAHATALAPRSASGTGHVDKQSFVLAAQSLGLDHWRVRPGLLMANLTLDPRSQVPTISARDLESASALYGILEEVLKVRAHLRGCFVHSSLACVTCIRQKTTPCSFASLPRRFLHSLLSHPVWKHFTPLLLVSCP